MLDWQQLVYIALMLILVSFLFSFWLIVVWIGLVHCYIYLTEWKKARWLSKQDKRDFFERVEEYKNDFK